VNASSSDPFFQDRILLIFGGSSGAHVTGNFGDTQGNKKGPKNKAFFNFSNVIKTPKSAFQAYDEGSIPFTRSISFAFQYVTGRVSGLKCFLEQESLRR